MKATLAWALALFAVAEFLPAAVFTSSNLPVLVIDTRGKPVPNDVRIQAFLGTIDHGDGRRNALSDPFDGYTGPIRIEIRGSSAVWQRWPKQSYAFETVDSAENAVDTPLLGLPGDNDWVLYGPYTDKTFMRDALAYKMARETGRYAPRTRFCELVLNGNYRGVYVLVEKIKRGRNRVAVAGMDSTDVSGDALTGGYIFKVDRSAGEENDGWTSSLSPSPEADRKVQYLYHYPRPSAITGEQGTFLRDFMEAFEALLWGPDWRGPLESRFDVGAFIDYVLVNELTRNVDAYSLSTFLHKDRDSRDGRLRMGPVWDYNLGFGNADYYAGDSTSGWMIDRKVRLRDRIPFWVGTLWNEPGIRSQFARRYRELRGGALATKSLFAWIDAWAESLAEAEARDHALYPVLGTYVWPNPFVGATYAEELGYLKDWIRDRSAWMDMALSEYQSVDGRVPVSMRIGRNYPNPFNGCTTLPFVLGAPARMRIRIFDVQGRAVAGRDLGMLSAGAHRFTWNAGSMASGVYVFELAWERGSLKTTAVLIR